jgi:hypothetical protein
MERALTEDVFLAQFDNERKRLEKAILMLYAAQQVAYAYRRLKALKVELTMDFMFEVETLTSALVTAYGRLFTETEGVTKLNEAKVPDMLKPVHDELMALRHKRHAHHGDHPTVGTAIDYDVQDDRVDLNFTINMTLCLGAPRHWEDLVDWVNGYVSDAVHGQLVHLTNISGRTWVWREPPED